MAFRPRLIAKQKSQINLKGLSRIVRDFFERREARKNASREARILCRPVYRATLRTDAPRKPKWSGDLRFVLRTVSIDGCDLLIDDKPAPYSEFAGLRFLCDE